MVFLMVRCKAIKKNGEQCTKTATTEEGYCMTHFLVSNDIPLFSELREIREKEIRERWKLKDKNERID